MTMKQAFLTAIGTPATSVTVKDVTAPDAPGPGEVVMEMHACPINPAELLIIEGLYAVTPELPAELGIEGAGIVTAVGDGVTHLKAGDKVMSLDRANWRQLHKLKVEQVIALPADIDLEQAAMLKVNPATAMLMLENYVTLQPGDWVVQNAANSAVGLNVTRLAKHLGFNVAGIVRREAARALVEDAGADVVLIDGDDVGARFMEASGGVGARLGLDAVAGDATRRLGTCLGDGGIVVNYGFLSGDACTFTPNQLVFEDKTLTGYWMAKTLREMKPADVQALYGRLIPMITNGVLKSPIEATYSLDNIADALSHSARGERNGKILIKPNG